MQKRKCLKDEIQSAAYEGWLWRQWGKWPLKGIKKLNFSFQWNGIVCDTKIQVALSSKSLSESETQRRWWWNDPERDPMLIREKNMKRDVKSWMKASVATNSWRCNLATLTNPANEKIHIMVCAVAHCQPCREIKASIRREGYNFRRRPLFAVLSPAHKKVTVHDVGLNGHSFSHLSR